MPHCSHFVCFGVSANLTPRRAEKRRDRTTVERKDLAGEGKREKRKERRRADESRREQTRAEERNTCPLKRARVPLFFFSSRSPANLREEKRLDDGTEFGVMLCIKTKFFLQPPKIE